jgi:hypothetical protein
VIATAGVQCSRCKRTSVTPLARDGDRQRFSCDACGENFSGPALPGAEPDAAPAAPKFSYAPIGIPDKSAVVESHACPKCRKPYLNLGKPYERHVASCDGTPYRAPRKRGARVQPEMELAPEPEVIFERSLAALRARKLALEAELRGLDATILEIEKLRGAGGAASAPFVPSARSSLSA